MRILMLGLLAILAAVPALGGTWFDTNTIQHDGLTRYFRYYLPDNLPANHPVVFILHGGGGGMASTTSNGAMAEWPEIADEDGILLIVPNGVNPDTGDTGGDDQNWNDCRVLAPAVETGADDVGFISALIDWSAAQFQPDMQKVYVTGASNGGMMSYRLGWELDDRIAAIAAYVANLPSPDECVRPLDPVPIFISNGDAETNYMPWDGGCVYANGPCDRGTVIAALDTRDWWIRFSRCDPAPAESIDYPDLDPDDGVTVSSDLYTGGTRGAEVIFYRNHGGGHTTPSIDHPRPPLVLQLLGLGNQSHDIEGARESWAFLRRHTLDGTPPAGTDPGEAPYLRVGKEPGGGLRLEWSEDCGAGSGFGVYRGDLTAGYGSLRPEPGFCDVPDRSAVLPTGEGAADFFLVVPNTGSVEGSYGVDSADTARPASPAACYSQGGLNACALP